MSDASPPPRDCWRTALVDTLAAFPRATDAEAVGIPLGAPSYGLDDVSAAAESLLGGWPTLGPGVRAVEAAFAEILGAPHPVMVSSGGGANLLIFLYLTSPAAPESLALHRGDEVIVPALGWSTTVTPVLATGCTPVFVDVDRRDLGLDPRRLAAALSPRTRAVMAVHALGVPCQIVAIRDFCRAHGLILIEDCCEAVGSAVGERSVGTFGDLASFSFYYSHQITSVEGGMITTPSGEVASQFDAMRNNGYRMAPARRDVLGKPWWEDSTLFSVAGFNFKPTDVGAALLRGQLARLPTITRRRSDLASGITDRLLARGCSHLDLPAAPPGTLCNWLGYPMVIRDAAPFQRRDLCRRLADRGIATRPIICGNLASQPFLSRYRVRRSPLPVADRVHHRGLMVGLHPDLTECQIDLLVETTARFLEARRALP